MSMFVVDDPRLAQILDMIGRMAALDFKEELPASKKNDVLDAIIVGLNMLSEELQSNMVEKSKLYHVNTKLEKFALTAAHDLKSPINSISGITSLIELSLKSQSKEEILQYVALLKSTTEKMKELVTGILDYSRHSPDDIELEVIDTNQVIQQIVRMDRIDLFAKLSIPQPLPVVQFNKLAMMQIFRNIFSNAIKYCDKQTCEITVKSIEKKDHHEIRIIDNGPGIALENQKKIFELFNRAGTDADQESQGIGLASVKSVLTSFNQKIWVESTPGYGSQFCFTLSK